MSAQQSTYTRQARRSIQGRDLLAQALLSLGHRRFRTFLSVLGVAIGISAVILIGVVSEGGKNVVYSELQTFGLRTVWIYRDRKILDPQRLQRAGSGITNEDLIALGKSGCCTSVARFSPLVYNGRTGANLLKAGNKFSRVNAVGVGPDYMEINNDSTSMGRGLNADDIARKRKVIVIGETTRRELFGSQSNPLGMEVQLYGQTFEVIGVLAHKDRSFLSSIGSSGGGDADARALIPYNRQQAIMGSKDIDTIQAQLVNDQAPAALGTGQIIAFLQREHKGNYDYRADTMEQYIETADKILGGVSKIGIIAASVSLFVAGLGILNIMSTSVLERTREIGLRKALGGTERSILLQFLLEAALISGLGGVLGLLLGFATSYLIVQLTGFPLLPSPVTALLALVVSVVIGLISGFYPAYRAAALRPVEALRYE